MRLKSSLVSIYIYIYMNIHRYICLLWLYLRTSKIIWGLVLTSPTEYQLVKVIVHPAHVLLTARDMYTNIPFAWFYRLVAYTYKVSKIMLMLYRLQQSLSALLSFRWNTRSHSLLQNGLNNGCYMWLIATNKCANTARHFM